MDNFTEYACVDASLAGEYIVGWLFAVQKAWGHAPTIKFDRTTGMYELCEHNNLLGYELGRAINHEWRVLDLRLTGMLNEIDGPLQGYGGWA